MCRSNTYLLRYLERGARLLHENYYDLQQDTERGEDHGSYDSYNIGRRSGLHAGIIWLEGAISLLEVNEEKEKKVDT